MSRTNQVERVADPEVGEPLLDVPGALEDEAVMAVGRERIAIGQRVVNEDRQAQARACEKRHFQRGILGHAHGGAHPVKHERSARLPSGVACSPDPFGEMLREYLGAKRRGHV